MYFLETSKLFVKKTDEELFRLIMQNKIINVRIDYLLTNK